MGDFAHIFDNFDIILDNFDLNV